MFKLPILVLLVAFLTWAYHATQSPPPTICGSPDGPPVTAPRIKLRDGRHLAYVERGVSKEVANYKIITVHGISSCKDLILPASQELIEELGIYLLSYDRAGYGESDPYPNRSVESEVYDLQELADQLNLGDKFYVFGISMGGCTVWGCLKYIPHRIAGATMAVPVVNYWWPSLPSDLLNKVSKSQLLRDRLAVNLAHNTPRLYSWITQRWLSSPERVQMDAEVFSPKDKETLKKMIANKWVGKNKALQQGVFESLHRDLLVGFGNWGFNPLELKNPFPQNESSVHIWQGYEDRLVPVLLQRHVSERLPWIKYHEIRNAGHLLPFTDNLFDEILKALFIGHEATAV
ncbi:hypothetical protein ACHQM5_009950 [Ranunculus cassubicifolius]